MGFSRGLRCLSDNGVLLQCKKAYGICFPFSSFRGSSYLIKIIYNIMEYFILLLYGIVLIDFIFRGNRWVVIVRRKK